MMHSTLSATNLNGYDIATVLKPPSHLKKTVCSYEQMGRGDKRAVLKHNLINFFDKIINI